MTKRDRIMLGAIVVIAVLGAAWMLAIKPKRQDAAALADQAAQALQRRDAALASLANAKQARAEFADAQIGIARMGKAVPADEDIATLVFQLEGSARKAGIDFRSVRLEQSDAAASAPAPAATAQPAGANVKKVPFKLVFEGDFFDLRRFIDHANSFTRLRDGKYVSVRGRLIEIQGVSMLAGPDGFPGLRASLTAVAYTAPAPEAPTAAPATGAAATPAAGSAAAPASGTPASATTSTEVAR